jgi:cardiolipin synthase
VRGRRLRPRGGRARGREPLTLRRLVRRAVLTTFGLQLLLAISLTLIDSYRRRGKKPKPFPHTPPTDVRIGDGTITSYTYGAELYEDMLAAIAGAQHQVLLESYIWKGDATGERFKQALYDAAARGVEVYAIFDGFANLVVSPRFKRFRPPVKVLRYPVYAAGLRFFDLRRYGRDHRKILVVDDEVAFVGGYNLGTPYATDWRDTHCRVTGPAVLDLKRAFADFWNLNRTKRFQMPRNRVQPLLTQTATAWEPQVRVHRNVPRLWMFPIRAMYIEAINKAERNVWLTHAYFIPDENFIETLTDAAERGVDVRLVLPAKSNHIVADWISRGYFTRMLESGIRIFRFRDAMVHAKTATIDGSWSTIGTANVDRLSMTGNYEINLEIIDADLAAEMERIFLTDEANSVEMRTEEWRSRDIYRRFTEALLRPLRHVL